jgi:hypothetical protein
LAGIKAFPRRSRGPAVPRVGAHGSDVLKYWRNSRRKARNSGLQTLAAVSGEKPQHWPATHHHDSASRQKRIQFAFRISPANTRRWDPVPLKPIHRNVVCWSVMYHQRSCLVRPQMAHPRVSVDTAGLRRDVTSAKHGKPNLWRQRARRAHCVQVSRLRSRHCEELFQ